MHDDNRVRDECLDFVQRCQCVAGDWRSRDFVGRVTSVWQCLRVIPESRTPADRSVLASAVMRMAVEVLRRTENASWTSRNSGPRARVESLVALLRLEHGARGIELKTLAVRVGINHWRLSRLLAAETQQPFHVHLGGWRVLSAVVLLGYCDGFYQGDRLHRWLCGPGRTRSSVQGLAGNDAHAVSSRTRSRSGGSPVAVDRVQPAAVSAPPTNGPAFRALTFNLRRWSNGEAPEANSGMCWICASIAG